MKKFFRNALYTVLDLLIPHPSLINKREELKCFKLTPTRMTKQDLSGETLACVGYGRISMSRKYISRDQKNDLGVMFHEIAHVLLGHTEPEHRDPWYIRETTVELVASRCLRQLGYTNDAKDFLKTARGYYESKSEVLYIPISSKTWIRLFVEVTDVSEHPSFSRLLQSKEIENTAEQILLVFKN